MAQSSSPSGTPPNIVFVHTDSMDGRVFGAMNHPAMRRATPHIDELARRGVMFRNTYTNNPICCCSRASMWSGQYTHHCEGWNNFKGLEPTDPTFKTHLEAAGYRVPIYGKTDYLSGQHTIRARVSPWTRSANILRPNYRMDQPRILDGERTSHDWDLVASGVKWLQEQAKAETRPFMLNLGLHLPHPPFRSTRRWLDMIDESGVDLPRSEEYDHPSLHYQRIVKNWQHGLSDEAVKLVRRIYFAMIAETDALLGEVMKTLDDLGLSDNTYLIFSSDHGELAMEHQQYYKMSLFEASARVPLIIAGPGLRQGGAIDDLVSLVDIYPTLMDMARLPQPAGLDGHSLYPLLRGEKSNRPDYAFSETHESSNNTGHFMVRRGDWKYIAYPGYEPHLFNLADDPDEVRNLAKSNPAKAREMDSLLRHVCDYEAVDAKVKAYDRRSFAHWRQEQKTAGTYQDLMTRIFSGWDRLTDNDLVPWTAEDEKQIARWLES